ncbi:unnamed protein product [Closterium sp. NIES-65]|nr:unnamed protein product [Closterium sp. NIES-65]
MKRTERRSAVGVGVGALVAGLVALSLLATQASADECFGLDCGFKDCLLNTFGQPVCIDSGEEWNPDACLSQNLFCGEAECVVQDGTTRCQCKEGFVLQKDTYKCIADVCYKYDCGTAASCSVGGDGTPKCSCNVKGLIYDNEKRTCNDACYKYECGPAASCSVVGDGAPKCSCNVKGLIYDEKDKSCNAADPCKTGTLRCGKNSKCVLRYGQGSCECDAGYTKKSGLCTAVCKRACPVNAQCTVERGKPVCQCRQAFKMDNNKCTRKREGGISFRAHQFGIFHHPPLPHAPMNSPHVTSVPSILTVCPLNSLPLILQSLPSLPPLHPLLTWQSHARVAALLMRSARWWEERRHASARRGSKWIITTSALS